MILEAKLRYKMRSEYVDRRRVTNWLDGQIKKHPVQLFYGCCGMGKTSTVVGYVRGVFHERYGYLQLDRTDNDEISFRSYFAAMTKQPLMESLSDQIFHFLTYCEGQKKPCALIFDGIEYINNDEILEALGLLMRYAGSSCVLFFIAEGQLPDFWKQKEAEGQLFVADIRKIVWKTEELVSYFRTSRIALSERLRSSMVSRTGGCPGLLEIERREFEEASGEKLEELKAPYARIDEYIHRNVWQYLTGMQDQLLCAAYIFPYIDGSFCQSVLEIESAEAELLWLRAQGIVSYDRMRQMYTLPAVLRGYIGRSYGDKLSYRPDTFLAAVKWYEENGRYRAASLVLSSLGDSRYMRQYICHYVRELFFTLSRDQLFSALSLISGEEQGYPEILFYKGVIAICDGNLTELDRVEDSLRELTDDSPDHLLEHSPYETSLHLRKELYLNLCYMDYRISITDWMDLAEDMLADDERIEVYSITGEGFSLCFGYKNLTEFFLHGIRPQREYMRRWQRIFCEEQQTCFEMAEAEYLFETGREKQALDKIRKISSLESGSGERNQHLSMFSLLCRLYRKGIGQDIYESKEAEIVQEIRVRYDPFHFVGALAHRDCYTGYHADRSYIRSWLLFHEERNSVKIRHENAEIYRMKAQVHLLALEYSSARSILETLEEIYRRENDIYHYTECIFAQAVAVYEQGEKSQALKLATKALTMGIKFRFINLYCNYGKTGYELIVMYQDMIAGGVRQSQRKKKYFYGNIIRASYEEYEETLLRAAKKAVRSSQMDDEDINAINVERLTSTEVTVLNFVSYGLSNQEIAEEMNVKLTTIKTHLSSIFRKLDVKNRQGAVREAQRREIL